MFDWSAPLVLLLLLGLLPLLRWLHRRGEPEHEIVVSALFLWPDAHDAAVRRRDRRVDPRWRRRALIVTLLVTAAAGPLLVRPARQRIDVYFDDAPSMRAREPSGIRLAEAARALVAALQPVGAADLRLISLREPGRTLTLDPRMPGGWVAAIEGWADLRARTGPLPTRAAFAADRAHWVVTDGADPAVADWLRRIPIERIVWVGTATENAAVTLLAVRPRLRRPQEQRGIVRVKNAGTHDVTRRLEVTSAMRTVVADTLELAPGAIVERAFDIPADEEAQARAVITPADAVPEDDALTLSSPIAPRARVRMDPHCGSVLSRAITSHPGLLVVADGESELTVWCDDAPPSPAGALLWFRGRAPLAGERSPPSTVLAREGPPRVVEVRADTESRERVERPEFAAFVAEVLDRALHRSLLDPIARVEFPEDAARIAPHEPPSAVVPPRTVTARVAEDLSGVTLVVAALLLIADAWRTRSAR